MSKNLNASERCTSRIDERGVLQQFIHEEWRDVEGYFAYDKMVELITLSYKGKLENCQILDVIFWPYSERT
jgi:hypothetical protein